MESSKFGTVLPPADADLRFLLAMIEQGAQGAPGRRVLVDMSGRAAPVGEVESVLLGDHMGQHLRSLERIAILTRHRTGHSERVARRMGTNLRVFTSREEAVDWLNASDE